MTTLNVKDFGAIGDGRSHPISAYYNWPDQAKDVYPFADSPDNEIDRCAIQAAIYAVPIIGGEVFIPGGSYLIDKQLKVIADNIEIRGAGPASTSLQRFHAGTDPAAGDFGATITFAFAGGFLNYVGVSGLKLTDASNSMTLQKSPFHVVFDGCTNVTFNQVAMEDGTGLVALLGCDQVYSDQCYARMLHGNSTQQVGGTTVGRDAVFIGPSGNAMLGSDGTQCSDVFFTNLNVKMRDPSFAFHGNTGVHVRAVDGLWLTSAHIEGSTFANLHLDCMTTGKVSNVYVTNLMSDICAANGIVIEGAAGAPCKRVKIEGQCSVARIPAGTGNGVMTKGAGVQDLDLNVGVNGHKMHGIQIAGTDDTHVVIRPKNIIDGGNTGNCISIEAGSDIVVSGGNLGGNINGDSSAGNGKFYYGVYVGPNAAATTMPSNVSIDTSVQGATYDGILINGVHGVSVRGVSRNNGGTGLRIQPGSGDIDFNLRAFGNTGLAVDGTPPVQINNALAGSGSNTTSPYWIKQDNVEHA